jgi:hypothetical protein
MPSIPVYVEPIPKVGVGMEVSVKDGVVVKVTVVVALAVGTAGWVTVSQALRINKVMMLIKMVRKDFLRWVVNTYQ